MILILKAINANKSRNKREMSVFPGTSEAAAAPLAVGERIGVFNFHIRNFAYDHLRDSVATLDRIRLLSGI